MLEQVPFVRATFRRDDTLEMINMMTRMCFCIVVFMCSSCMSNNDYGRKDLSHDLRNYIYKNFSDQYSPTEHNVSVNIDDDNGNVRVQLSPPVQNDAPDSLTIRGLSINEYSHTLYDQKYLVFIHKSVSPELHEPFHSPEGFPYWFTLVLDPESGEPIYHIGKGHLNSGRMVYPVEPEKSSNR